MLLNKSNYLILLFCINWSFYAAGSIYKDIPDGRRYNEIMWIGAHNANCSHAYGWGTVNQNVSLETMLAKNVRLFLLDIHFKEDEPDREIQRKSKQIGDEVETKPKAEIDSKKVILSNEKINEVAKTPVMCHGDCAITKGLLRPISLTMGLEKLSKYIALFGKFLRENPREIISVYFESYTGMDLEAIFQKAEVSDLIFRVKDSESLFKQNPSLWPTIGELRKAGKRLIFFTNNHSDNGAMVFSSFAKETHWDLMEGDHCRSRTGSESLSTINFWLLNNFYSWVFGDTLASDSRFTLLPNHGLLNSDDLIERIEEKCLSAWKSLPVWLGLDFAHRQSSGFYKTGKLGDWVKKVNQLPPELFYNSYSSISQGYKDEINKYFNFEEFQNNTEIKELYQKYKTIISPSSILTE